MRLAIFDIDGTLLRGGTERQFWRYLLRRGRQGPRQIAAHVAVLLRLLPVHGAYALKLDKAYLAGLRVDDVDALAREFVAATLPGQIFEPAAGRLRAHVDGGDAVVLVSGTLDCIARALAAYLGAGHVVATECATRDGRYLARPAVVHPFGVAKLELTRALAATLGADLGDAAVYANSRDDLSLLGAAGTPVAVLPDAALRRAAERNGWEIIDGSPAPAEQNSR